MTGAYLKISDEKSLELRFTARRAEKLESELDCDLLRGLSRCQRVGVLTRFIACGADISHSEACDAYDEFVDNGGTIEDASEVVMTALKNGGFIAKSAVEAAKRGRGMRKLAEKNRRRFVRWRLEVQLRALPLYL